MAGYVSEISLVAHFNGEDPVVRKLETDLKFMGLDNSLSKCREITIGWKQRVNDTGDCTQDERSLTISDKDGLYDIKIGSHSTSFAATNHLVINFNEVGGKELNYTYNPDSGEVTIYESQAGITSEDNAPEIGDTPAHPPRYLPAQELLKNAQRLIFGSLEI